MNLTLELKDLGRRNFLRAMAGLPAAAAAALGAAGAAQRNLAGGPVKAAIVGAGSEGRMLLGRCRKEFIDIKAVCDINPRNVELGSDVLVKSGYDAPHHYEDWREMLQKEDLEAVIVGTPLWSHADIAVGCLEAGKHVLCEKMMAWNPEGCRRMLEASRKNRRLLEIGYQRYYNPMYQSAFAGVIKPGVIGEIYHARLVWHRNGSWRRDQKPPAPDYDPSRWGYPTWDHLINWRLYKKYSGGLMAELGSHQLAVANWFLDSQPRAVYATGGTHRYRDGREVFDHIYSTYEYPGGRTVTFSSIQSNKFEDHYEMFLGTKGTLILERETEALLFNESDGRPTSIELSTHTSEPVVDASETRPSQSGRTATRPAELQQDRLLPYQLEIAEFCSAIRTGGQVRCGPEKAMISAVDCLLANKAAEKQARLEIPA